MARVAREALARSWTRAQEDDSGGTIAFRPSEADFTPQRRPREGLELLPDGTLRQLGAGPADRREAVEGGWELDGDELLLRVGGGPPRRYEVQRADEHELRLRELG